MMFDNRCGGTGTGGGDEAQGQLRLLCHWWRPAKLQPDQNTIPQPMSKFTSVYTKFIHSAFYDNTCGYIIAVISI